MRAVSETLLPVWSSVAAMMLALQALDGLDQVPRTGRCMPPAGAPPPPASPAARRSTRRRSAPARGCRPADSSPRRAESRCAAAGRCPATSNCVSTSSAAELELHVRLVEALRRVAQEERAEVRDLLATVAQRRDVDADDAEPVVRDPRGTCRRRHAVRGRRWWRPAPARPPPIGRGSPTGRISPCSRKRSSLGWTSSGMSPISSRNSVPPAAERMMPG